MNTIKPFLISLHQATNLLGVFQRLSTAVMPARLSFIAARNLAALAGDPSVIAAEQKRSQLIREKYGKPLPDGAGFTVPPEKLSAYHAEFAPIGREMVELKLQVFPKDAPDSFPPISPNDVLALQQFIESDQEPATPAPPKKRKK